MRTKAIIRLLFSLGVITWLALVFTDISIVLTASMGNVKQEVPGWIPGILLNLYIVSVFYFYRLKIERDEILNFVDLLWRVFATGLVSTVVSLSLWTLESMMGDTRLTNHAVFKDFVYLVN